MQTASMRSDVGVRSGNSKIDNIAMWGAIAVPVIAFIAALLGGIVPWLGAVIVMTAMLAGTTIYRFLRGFLMTGVRLGAIGRAVTATVICVAIFACTGTEFGAYVTAAVVAYLLVEHVCGAAGAAELKSQLNVQKQQEAAEQVAKDFSEKFVSTRAFGVRKPAENATTVTPAPVAQPESKLPVAATPIVTAEQIAEDFSEKFVSIRAFGVRKPATSVSTVTPVPVAATPIVATSSNDLAGIEDSGADNFDNDLDGDESEIDGEHDYKRARRKISFAKSKTDKDEFAAQ